MTQWSLGSWIRCRHRRSFYRVGWIDSQSRGFYCCQGSIAFLWRKLDRSWQCPCLGRMASTKFYAFLLPLPVASSGSQCSPRLSLCRSQYSRNLWDEVWAISRDPGLNNWYGKVEDDLFVIAEPGVVDHGGVVLVTVVFLDFGEESLINGNSNIEKMGTSWFGRWLTWTCSSWWFLFSRDRSPGSTLCIWACWVW